MVVVSLLVSSSESAPIAVCSVLSLLSSLGDELSFDMDAMPRDISSAVMSCAILDEVGLDWSVLDAVAGNATCFCFLTAVMDFVVQRACLYSNVKCPTCIANGVYRALAILPFPKDSQKVNLRID
eukprot:2459610-Ditylum_brightwellii.AAC.1